MGSNLTNWAAAPRERAGLATVLIIVCQLVWGASVQLAQTRPITDGSPSSSTADNSAATAQSRSANQVTGAGGSVPGDGAASPDELEAAVRLRIDQVQLDTERSEEQKAALLQSYNATLLALDTAGKLRQQIATWEERVQAAPTAIELARERAAQLESADDGVDDAQLMEFELLSFEEAQARLRDLETQLAEANKQRNGIQDELTSREQRRQNLPQLISEATAEWESLPAATTLPKVEDPVQAEAQRWAHEANRHLLQAQVQVLESESRAYEAELPLLPLQQELAQADAKLLQKLVNSLGVQLNERRKSRIIALADQFQSLDGTDTRPFESLRGWLRLGPATDSGLSTGRSWLEIVDQRMSVQSELERVQRELTRWKENRAKMTARVEAKHHQDRSAGFSSWVGLMLRKQRSKLPNPDRQSARLSYFRSEMQQADSMLFELDDALHEVRTLQDGSLNEDNPPDRLKLSQDILTEMKSDVEAYLNELYEVADAREQTRQFSRDYRAFIDKHVLWIQSGERLQTSDWQPGTAALRWLLDFGNWRAWMQLLARDAMRQPVLYGLLGLAMGILVFNYGQLKRRLIDVTGKAGKKTCVEFSLTTSALLITVLRSLPLSLLLVFLGWRINQASGFEAALSDSSEFARSIAGGCLVVAGTLFPMELFRQVCHPEGLGVKHFGWQPANASTLRSNLRWLIDFAIPLLFVVGIFAAQSDARWELSVGRVAFMLLMPLLSVFFARLFSPRHGIFSGYLREHAAGWIDQLSYLWYPLLILGPLALAVVSFLGFHYTAQRIAAHMNVTLWMVVLLTVFYFALKRWLVLNRRQLMMAQARHRLELAAKREPDLAANPKVIDDDEVNLVAINDQTRRLASSLVIAAGLVLAYFIWSDIIPAISFLDNVTLWNVAGAVPEEDVNITLANLVLVIPLVVLTVIAARNVPGLLEIALLQHLPLTNAARYAITTLARYAIVALGIVIVASTIGLQWNSIQWLVAALGVGLGFGLQEIFANFVSGLILLFEQPIRVGDIITIDGTTGTVSKIRMRATTVVNWDRQELIIPNKELITGKLLNWTLTDTTNRVVLNIGVAYGSDTEKACSLIRQVCNDYEEILGDPAPNITFEGFGDNALNLVLRVFLENLENRLGTIHELHQRIYHSLNANKIELAFPQRDLHVKTLPKGLSRWLGQGTRESANGSVVSESGLSGISMAQSEHTE